MVVGRSGARVEEMVEEIAGKTNGNAAALGLALDVRREGDMAQMASRTRERFGRIDILVSCAGVAKSSGAARLLPYSLAQMPLEEWGEIVDTNLKGTFLSNRAVLPEMMGRQSGTIVNVSSSPGGIKGQPFAAAYCASKFGVLGLSEALAEEATPYGIKVQVVFPDAIDTPLLRRSTLEARLGPSLPADRVASLILYIATLPEDTQLLSSRRMGCSVLRRTPSEPHQWIR